jgi:DNA repair photolyase
MPEALFEPVVSSATARGYSVLACDLDAGPTLIVARRGRTVMVELDARDETAPCWNRTERFNVYARPLHDGDRRSLTDDERQLAEEIVELLRVGERTLPEFDRPVTTGKARVREVRAERVLMAEGDGQYYVNPYVGCMIGCAFCWAADRADFSRGLRGLPSLPWGRWVDVKIDAPEVLRRELRSHAPGPVRMSPVVTDPYQPLEKRYRITRGCLEALLPAGFSPVILTRAARVLDDLPLLKRFERAAVGLSIPTDDDRVRQRFEPGADPIEDRIETLVRLKEAGIHTFGVVQPVLPMNVDALVARVAPLVRAVRVDRMQAMERVAPLYHAAGAPEAAEAAWIEHTLAAVREGFRAHGVRLDELDDMSGLLASLDAPEDDDA